MDFYKISVNKIPSFITQYVIFSKEKCLIAIKIDSKY